MRCVAARFTYSRWDGTQRGFELDADAVFEAIADELVQHGDVNAALRKLLHGGLDDRNGERVMGLREIMERIRQQREERVKRGDLGGVYNEIAEELNDIIDEERHAIDDALRAAENSGDDRRADNARQAASERNIHLDLLADDLAGKVKGLQSYNFESSDAARRFEQLLDKLREQLMQQSLDKMGEAMQQMTPQDMQRTKEMLASLNEMIERRQRGQDPGFEQFMDQFGDFFPENPQTLDELLESMAQRMAAAQAMLNSMTPEQRQQLAALSQQLLDDMDLQWQMSQLAGSLQSMFPGQNWNSSYRMRGDQPMGFDQAMQTMQELGQLEQMEQFLRQASSPAQLAEADMDRVRDLLGDDAANSLERLAELARQLEQAGLVQQRDGRMELTPKGLRKIGSNALRDLYSKLAKDKAGQHQLNSQGQGHERSYETKSYEFGDSFRLDLQRTIRNALQRGTGTPVRLRPEDFEIEQTEHLTRSSTVLLLDLSMSMPMRDNFVPAKKVAFALHSLISSQFPRDYLGLVGFGESARIISIEDLPEVSWDYAYGTNMHHAMMLARKMLGRQAGTKQIIMITDGEPTAHIRSDGSAYFNYPPSVETVEVTLREALRCTKDNIRINVFMLDADRSLKTFVERLTALNHGRAFFTNKDTLGDYVLVDFIDHKKRLVRATTRRNVG